jgi:hypothetical protein
VPDIKHDVLRDETQAGEDLFAEFFDTGFHEDRPIAHGQHPLFVFLEN